MQAAIDFEISTIDTAAELEESIQQTSRLLLGGAAGGLIASYVSGGVTDSVLTILVGSLLVITLAGDMVLKFVLALILPPASESASSEL